MANIFLDTNFFIDAVHRRPEANILEQLKGHKVHISPLSVHIYCYTFKINLPNDVVISQIEPFQLIDFTGEILKKSIQGPTKDFEDNVQLNSGAESNCDIFLTSDKKLLKMKFFGQMEIKNTLS